MQFTGLIDLSRIGLNFPSGLLGWVGFIAACIIFVVYLITWRKIERSKRVGSWTLFFLLIVLIPIIAFFGGFDFSPISNGSVQSLPAEMTHPMVIIFAAIPFTLAAGFFGIIPSVLVGLISGLIGALCFTHNPFTIIEYASAAALISFHVSQNYQSRYYSLVRHPFIASIATVIYLLPILVLTTFFAIPGPLSIRLDYALQNSFLLFFSRSIEIITAGFFAELIMRFKPNYWITPAFLVPSPEQMSIQKRFLFISTRFFLFLGLGLIIFTWVMAVRAARQMVNDRLSGIALLVSETVPVFLETGQDFLTAEASSGITSLAVDQMENALAEQINAIPFFDQIYIFNSQGNLEAGYPDLTLIQSQILVEEEVGVRSTLSGQNDLLYVVIPPERDQSAFISFFAPSITENGIISGVLLGRTEIGENPFMQAALQSLDQFGNSGGEAYILDSHNRIIFSTTDGNVIDAYPIDMPAQIGFFEPILSDGSETFGYYLPIDRTDWSVILLTSSAYAQQAAYDIALPLLIIFLSFSVLGIIVIRISLNSIAGTLDLLGQKAGRIAEGYFNDPVHASGLDEVGRLGNSFDEMRQRLKTKIEQMNSLLLVSQRVSSRIKFDDGFIPLLTECLKRGSISARLLIKSNTLFEESNSPFVTYKVGEDMTGFQELDFMLFRMMESQPILAVPNTLRTRRMDFPQYLTQPGSLLSFRIKQDEEYLGVLWLGFAQPRNYDEDEVKFFNTLAFEAGVSIINSQLFLIAETGRQRLSSILAATPDPIIVIDENNKLVHANPAAKKLKGLLVENNNIPIGNGGIQNKEILNILTNRNQINTSIEINMEDGQTYQFSVSEIVENDKHFGRVGIFRNISNFKEMDKIKSEFVATVSHDLRTPLTMIRGYTTMLQMVGELNFQQQEYASRIISGVDEMSGLVRNLLNLERIELRMGIQKQQINLAEIIIKITEELNSRIQQKNITILRREQQNEQCVVCADSILLHQALYNLLDNAIKYSRSGGKIEVEINDLGSEFQISIVDNGVGIAPLDVPHIFDQDYPSRINTNPEKDSGLGLAIVKSIAERHNGRISVESTLGKGSTFNLVIPKDQEK